MISVTELRAGRTFQIDGVPYQVIEYKHTKMGRGTANIKLKIKNLKSKIIIEKTFISGARVQEISTLKRKLQYLYSSGDNFYFMEPKTFEQYEIPSEVISDQAPFFQEEALVDVLFWSFAGAQDKETPLSIELPPKMEFEVAETGPGVKGDSVTASFKPATLDNGLMVRVPLFVNVGDKIKVDTRTGEYLERVK